MPPPGLFTYSSCRPPALLLGLDDHTTYGRACDESDDGAAGGEFESKLRDGAAFSVFTLLTDGSRGRCSSCGRSVYSRDTDSSRGAYSRGGDSSRTEAASRGADSLDGSLDRCDSCEPFDSCECRGSPPLL